MNTPTKVQEFSYNFTHTIGKDFILQCLERDPHKRPNALTLLGHPFLTGGQLSPESASRAQAASTLPPPIPMDSEDIQGTISIARSSSASQSSSQPQTAPKYNVRGGGDRAGLDENQKRVREFLVNQHRELMLANKLKDFKPIDVAGHRA